MDKTTYGRPNNSVSFKKQPLKQKCRWIHTFCSSSLHSVVCTSVADNSPERQRSVHTLHSMGSYWWSRPASTDSISNLQRSSERVS